MAVVGTPYARDRPRRAPYYVGTTPPVGTPDEGQGSTKPPLRQDVPKAVFGLIFRRSVAVAEHADRQLTRVPQQPLGFLARS